MDRSLRHTCDGQRLGTKPTLQQTFLNKSNGHAKPSHSICLRQRREGGDDLLREHQRRPGLLGCAAYGHDGALVRWRGKS